MDELETKAQETGIAGQVDALLKDFLNQKMPALIQEKVEEGMNQLKENMKILNESKLPNASDDFASMKRWEKCAKFYSDFASGDTSFWTQKGLSEGVDSEGGFLVPDVVASEISRIAENYGVIRTLARRVVMPSDSFNIPTVESSVTTSWPGEGNSGTESNPVLGNRKLRAQTQVGISTMSNELLRDANQSIVSIVNNLFAEAFAGEEDDQGINGVGAPFTGVLVDSDVTAQVMSSGNTAFTNVTLQDLLDMTGQLKDTVVRNGVYLMHRTVWHLVLGLKEGSQTVYAFQNSGEPVLRRGERDAGITPVGMLHGKPVYVSDKMPDTTASAVSTKFIIFGNFGVGLAFGDREQMTLATSDSATVGTTNMFTSNQKAVRMTERVAIQIIQPTAFATLATAAS